MAFTQQQLVYYRNAFREQKLMKTPAVIGILDLYGMEVLEWLPETLRLEIQDDFQTPLQDPLLSRILTGFALLTTDDFYKSLPDFVMHCNILSGDSFNPELWDPADAGECAWGITEALLLSPPDDTDTEPFSSDITAYIGAVLNSEGIVTAPDVLRIAVRSQPDFDLGLFSEDPELAGAVTGFENSKTDEINQLVQAGIHTIMSQLQSMPLENGTADDILQKMQGLFTTISG
jgi:hypothetical protein